jgi:A/G-specific adenine glycosylase
MNQKTVVLALLKWFGENARDLPWRRTGDPYAIWVSEIMLQQTQVKTVVPYWERWMRDLPDITALAKARSEKIHKLWEGLGYYTRVRNMQSAARLICETHGGEFPRKFEDVLALPGIGPYTAGAICSIAFNQPTPILDGNVIRVLTRLFGIDGNPRAKETNKKLWGIARGLVEEAGFGVQASACCSKNTNASNKLKLELQTCSHLNQSLMELGALVCTARNPQCGICPVAKHCRALREKRVHELPNLGERPGVTQRRFVAFVAQRRKRVFVCQRAEGLVNAHLWEFPNVELRPTRYKQHLLAAARSALGMEPGKLEPFCTIKHSITRYRITLEVFRTAANSETQTTPQIGRWLNQRQLTRLPFSSAHRRILNAIEK